MELKLYKAKKLDIAYFDIGNQDSSTILLLHGWPDDAGAWKAVAEILSGKGFRLIIPYLRGFGATAFNRKSWIRDGSGVALVQDAIDLLDGLGIQSFFVAGHDWGARAAYQLAALFPVRVKAIAALSLAHQPHGEFKMPGFLQAKNFWYQWLMMVDAGAEAIAKDPVGFARVQWDTWGPEGWYRETDFMETSKSFTNPDWVEVTLNGYRRRFGWAATDTEYAGLSRLVATRPVIKVPTLVIQGGADRCDPPSESEGMEDYFDNGYRRVVIPGIGHFPLREAPECVAKELLAHFQAINL